MEKHLRRTAFASFALVCFVLGSVTTLADGFTDINAARSLLHPGGASARQPAMTLGAHDAGDVYHNGATLYCSQCHVMHASTQHPTDGALVPDPFGPFPQSFTPSPHLLKAADPVALCLTCHDGFAGIPDVVGADVNGLSDRAGGFFASANEDNPRGHKLEYGLSSDPNDLCYRCHFVGSFATASVTCIDCHNPHGNAKARNLQWASWPGGEPDFGLYTNAGATGMQKYESQNIGYGNPGISTVREVTNMCTDCHHVFSGSYYIDPNGNGIHNLHPTYDSERGSTNNITQGEPRGTTDPAHWSGGTGAGFLSTPRLRFVNHFAADYASATVVDPDLNGVFCLSCHKAHGSDKAFALAWDPVAGKFGEGCDQCHARALQ
ncbi:MAG: cytochrome c3 family protein [Candidatus Zixiibacteriota bacterium]